MKIIKTPIKSSSKRRSLKTVGLGLPIALLMLLVMALGCSKPEPNEKEISKNSDTDGFRTIEQGGDTREYILHVSSSYDNDTPIPLLINFHGFGGSASDFSVNVNINSLADDKGFLVAYPQGVERTKGGAEWDPGDNGSQNINENDLYFVEQLISDISKDYNVDVSRVYAAGYSNGGMMAYGLACSRSNLIAAVGIMSGIMLQPETCDSDEYTSIIHFHGIEDDVLPYNGNQNFQPVSDVIDFWLDHNNISAANLTTTQLNGGNVIKDEYHGGNDNTSVVLYTINSEYGKPGGHVWFSDEINGSSPNEILWKFLSGYSLED